MWKPRSVNQVLRKPLASSTGIGTAGREGKSISRAFVILSKYEFLPLAGELVIK